MWDDPRVWVLLTSVDGEVRATSSGEDPVGGDRVVDVIAHAIRGVDVTVPGPFGRVVPLYVDVADRDLDTWRVWAERTCAASGLPFDQVEVVELAEPRGAAERAHPVRLPLRVVVGRQGGLVWAALEERGNPWRTGSGGGDDAAATVTRLDDLRGGEGDADVLLVGDEEWEGLAGRREVGAELVVVAGPHADRASREGRHGSLLTVAGSFDSCVDLVDQLFWALSHDLALHDALHLARTDVAQRYPERLGRRADALLRATPVSVQALRLTPMLRDAQRRMTELSGVFGSLRVADDDLLSDAHGRFINLEPSAWMRRAAAVASLVPDPDTVAIDFERERLGLYPLLYLRERLDQVDRFLDDVTGSPANLGALDELERLHPPARVVNVGLRVVHGTTGSPSPRAYLEPTAVLGAFTPYDVDVQIGPAWQQSIVVGDRPAVDPSLPDARDGHDLTVCLFTDALDVPATTTTLHLPPTGASPLVSLRVVTRGPGPVWFRLGVYHRTNLVQTMLVTGEVARTGRRSDEPVLVARVDHTGTERWSNLEQVGPRDISFTLNDSGGAHRVFIKSEDTDATVALDDTALGAALTGVRGVLTQLIEDPGDATRLVVDLARRGAQLYTAVFDQLPREHRDALRRVRRQRDLAIQVVRADVQRALPWVVVYDWPVPEEIAGVADPPGCLGTVAGGPCGHSETSGVVCVNGFWSLRHVLEELLPDPGRRDPATAIPVSRLGALLASGIDAGVTQTFSTRVAGVVGPAAVRSLQVADELLPLMFASSHAGVLLLLGPYAGADVVALGAPVAQRIRLDVAEEWLTPARISTAAQAAQDWATPGPLVVLMSCSAAATRHTELTSFLAALNGAGAGAVIGAEVDLRADLATDFTGRLLEAMRPAGGAPGSSFAAAIRSTRRSYTDGGDIRALVFDAFGPAELTLS